MAVLLFPPFGFPRVWLPAQGPAPVVCVAGLTLGLIHFGKPPCLAMDLEKLQCRRRTRRERGSVGSTHPSFWKQICLWPLPRPPISSPRSHPDQVFRVLASLSLRMRTGSPLQAQPDLLDWSSVSSSILHACIMLISRSPT